MCQAPWSIRVSQARRPSQRTITGNSSPLAWCTVRIWTASAPTGCGGSSSTGSMAHSRMRAVTASKSSPSDAESWLSTRHSSRSRPRRWLPFGPSATTRANPVRSRRSRATAPGGRSSRPRRSSRISARASRSRALISAGIGVPDRSARSSTRSVGSSAKNGGRSSAASATPSSGSARPRRPSRNWRLSGSCRNSRPPREVYGMPASSSQGKRWKRFHVDTASTATSPYVTARGRPSSESTTVTPLAVTSQRR